MFFIYVVDIHTAIQNEVAAKTEHTQQDYE